MSRFAGTTLAGRYDVLELLGAGGMGEVYRARDRELDELVALKVVHAELAGDAAIVARFRDEVKLARRVTHANVARTYELGTADGVTFCTMELIEGEPLTRRLRGQAMPVAEAVAIASAVCEGLAAAHAAGVIHRDVKPDNVLLAADGRVVVADFGVAAISVAGGGELSGTPAYMAPEQARGEAATPAADVYAVGVMVYEMLTGHPAFGGGHASIFSAKQKLEHLELPPGPHLPPELSDVIARATARDRDLRVQTAGELRERLSPWIKAPRTTTSGPRPHVAARELRTLIVLPAVADRDDAPIHRADWIHEQLLHELSRRPRVRVQPRAADVADADATVIALHVGERLAVTARRPGDSHPVLALELPLALDKLATSASVACHVIAATLELDEPDHAAPAPEPFELFLRARYNFRLARGDMNAMLDQLARAREIAPGEPRIAATLARAMAWRAFIHRDAPAEMLARAVALAREAVATGPDLAEAHLAMGQVELHTGDVAKSAGHFRLAIACSPFLADAHEWLGRLLLEAGYVEDGIDRLRVALSISPRLASARWEIARVYALDGRWDDYDRLVGELMRDHDRLFARMRYTWWRGDAERIREVHAELVAAPDKRVFDLRAVQPLVGALEGKWYEHRDELIASTLDVTTTNRRRRAFNAQLLAEAAGAAGDLETCARMLEVSADAGLFDLHWLDRCVLLAQARAAGALDGVRPRVKARADAILDALYGDHALHATGDTVLATR